MSDPEKVLAIRAPASYRKRAAAPGIRTSRRIWAFYEAVKL